MAHPIESIMRTTMENLKEMIDVNTVVGEAVLSGDGVTIIPISKVSFGFVAGGGEYADSPPTPPAQPAAAEDMAFAGGTSAGVSVNPVGFLIVGNGQIKLLPASYSTPVERIVELVPQLVEDLCGIFCEKKTDDAGGTAAQAPAYPSEG